MLPNEPFCYTDLQYLTVPLPTEIAALRENADFAGEVRRIDKLLPRVTDTVMHKRLLLEIESTKMEASNSEQRLRRKAFYTANGMAALDYCVDLFGVEMEILTYRCDVSFEEYHSIFENVFSPRAAKNVKLIK